MSTIPFQSHRGFKGFLEATDGIEISNGKMKMKTPNNGFSFDSDKRLNNEWYSVPAGSNVDLSSNKITNVADPTASGDAINRTYLEDGKMEADIDLNNRRIKNIGEPQASGDITTKEYVDKSINGSYGQNLTPFGIPSDIVSNHFDGEISENIETDGTSGNVLKVWDNSGKGFNYTATDAMNFTYNSTEKRIEMTSTTGQRLKASTPVGLSNSGAEYSFTCVAEVNPDTASWEGIASVFASVFNGTRADPPCRLNTMWRDNGDFITMGLELKPPSDFWKPGVTAFGDPTKVVMSFNYNSSTSKTALYVNGRWAGELADHRTADEVNLGNDSDGFDFSHNGFIYECFLTSTSLTDKQIAKVHSYMNDKWNIYTKTKVDIFTMAGQSNMAGRGDSATSPKPEFGFYIDPQYWKANRTPVTTIIDPVGGNGAPDQANTGSAIPSFCEEYYNQTGRIPVILYVAQGSTSLFVDSEWNPDVLSGNLVDDAENILPLAKTKLEEMDYKIASTNIIWHQGEADRGTAVQTYKDQFLKLVDRLLNNGYENFYYYEIGESDTTDLANVREAQRLARGERDKLYMVWSCANLHAQNLMENAGDNFHYNQTGYNLMGRQGAKGVARIQKLT